MLSPFAEPVSRLLEFDVLYKAEKKFRFNQRTCGAGGASTMPPRHATQ